MPKGDRELLKADPDDGTTPISNLLLEALAMAKLTGKEKGIVLYLWRVTYGWLVKGERLKEKEISLTTWRKVLQIKDDAKASKILAGLVQKKVILRQSLGLGKGYIYSMNTRVVEWDRGCLNRQGLSKMTREGLSKMTRVPLPKTTRVTDTNLATPKESIKERLNKVDAKASLPNGQVKEVFKLLQESVPYKLTISFGKEGAFIKKILGAGFTPAQIIGCWKWLKEKPFWSDKWVSFAKVGEEMPSYLGKEKNGRTSIKYTNPEDA